MTRKTVKTYPILTARAANVLDMTHSVGERGPLTMKSRQIVAHWLDTGRGHVNIVRKAVAYLETVA